MKDFLGLAIVGGAVALAYVFRNQIGAIVGRALGGAAAGAVGDAATVYTQGGGASAPVVVTPPSGPASSYVIRDGAGSTYRTTTFSAPVAPVSTSVVRTPTFSAPTTFGAPAPVRR